MDLGPHAAFIWAAYVASLIVIAGLAGWIVASYRQQTSLLAELEKQGIKRRSARAKK